MLNSTRKFSVRAKDYAKKDQEIKERLKLLWNRLKGTLRARSHPAKLPTCEEKRPEKFSAPNNKGKVLQI